MKEKKDKLITVKMDNELHEDLRREAFQRAVSKSEVIRIALKELLAQLNPMD